MKTLSCLLQASFGLAIALTAMPHAASAAYPDHSMTLVVGFAPGGGTDTLARVFAQKLGERLGQPLVVVNKPGADGVIAAETVAHAPPDGYTLLMVTPNHTTLPSLRQLPYRPIDDFAAIAETSTVPNILVVNPAQVPVNSLAEFIALVKSKPGKFNFGSTGPGGPGFMAMQLLMSRADLTMVNVTFKGSADTAVALLGGEVQTMFGGPPDVMPMIAAGKLKALAVSTAYRSALLPDVPTVAEAANLPGFDVGVWYGMLAPAGTPKPIIARLNRELDAILKLPDVQKRLSSQGFVAVESTPEQFGEFLKQDVSKWADLIQTIRKPK